MTGAFVGYGDLETRVIVHDVPILRTVGKTKKPHRVRVTSDITAYLLILSSFCLSS